MGEMLNYEPTEAQFGVFWKYLMQPGVTDVDYNGKELWITDLKRGRYRAKERLSEQFISAFTHNISNCVNKQFNNANKILENQYLYPQIPLYRQVQHKAAACGGVLPGMCAASVDELRSGGHEFCVRRGTGGGQDGECKVFYAVHPQGGACHHDRGFA